VRELIDLQEPA
jgi:hypothetical protein